MATRKEFIQQLQERLEEVDGKLSAYEKKARELSRGAREDFNEEVTKIREQKEQMLYTLKLLKGATESAFNDLRLGAQRAFREMKASFVAAKEHLDP